ncbi:pectate lyase/pectin methylesterase-like acyl-CoA thioesterase [Paenibacillus sp. V4I9]|nr:pectate lyase/pectin methylesterase-like acyl-CoA thioesterase [Paenibacillus sp. V4I9]
MNKKLIRNNLAKLLIRMMLFTTLVPFSGTENVEAATALPIGWSNVDMGSPSSAGSSSYDKSTGTLTITGTGNGIAGVGTPQMQYAYTEVSGDFTMIARISSLTAASGTLQAGIRIRKDLDTASPYLAGLLTSSGALYFNARKSDGASAGTSTLASSGFSAPQYIRIRRQIRTDVTPIRSDIYMAYGTPSGDIITWTEPKADQFPGLLNTVYLGLIVGGIGTASFDKMTILKSNNNASTTSISSLTQSLPVSPSSPSGLNTVSGDAQVSLTWGSVSEATYYNVKRSEISGGSYYQLNTSNITDTNFTDTTAANSHTYYYVVTAANADGESTVSNEAVGKPLAPAALSFPTNLSSLSGNNQVDLTWDSLTDAAYYNIYRSQTNSGPYTKVNNANVIGTRFTDTTAVNGNTYYYVVTAANTTKESGYSNQVTAAPIAPVFPSTPILAASAGDSQVKLSWSSVSGATSYKVKRSLTAGGPYEMIDANVSGTSFTNTGLTNGTTYYYVVSAINSVGEGANSSEVSSKPGVFLINDNFENSTLGDVPAGYTPIANASDANINNVTVINNSNLTNKYYSPTEVSPAKNISPAIPGNSTNVLWINDNANASRRGGYTNAFASVSGNNGVTAQLDFMQPVIIGDSYPLELLNSTSNTPVLSFSVTNLKTLATINAGTWYNLKFVADTGTNSAEVYINGVYKGNFKFSITDTNISKIQARTAGSSTGSMYVDNVKVYKQIVTTPQKLTTDGANNTTVLNWNAASGADSYNVYRSETTGGPYAFITNVTSPIYTDTGLVNKKNYYYVVTGVNANGESDFSNEALGYPNNVSAPAIAPAFQQMDIRDSQLTLNWTSVLGKDEDGSAVPSYYTLVRSTTPSGPFETVAQKLTGTTYMDKNLTNDTEYYYQVTAGNMGGLSPGSELLKVAPAEPLGTPTLLKATAGNNMVDLSWSSVAKATTYTVKRSTVNGEAYTKIKEVTGTSFSDTETVNGTTYYYVVSAANAPQESMISNQLKAAPYTPVPGAPNKPSGLNAIANEGSVSLSWNTVSDATAYHVKRSTAIGGPYDLLSSSSSASYEDTNVTNGTTYYYVVSAVNASGESPITDEIIVLPAKVLTVDKNATANGTTVFNTIQSAVNAIPANNTARTIIYITSGTYTEKLTINRKYVSLIGAGMNETKIVYGDYAGTSATTGQPGHTGNTFLSQTVEVNADYFTASNLTIENSSSPRSAVAQAVALSLKSDKAVFESVKLVGYQDTLYTGLNSASKGRHYFHNSIIQGDVDFIFGEAPAVVFDNVQMVLVSNSGGGGHITAGAQKNSTDMGYVFLNSQVIDDPSALGTYDLGRPWKDNAKIRFINTMIDSEKFLPSGWVAACAGSCLSYSFAEYNSYGPGANPSERQIATQLTGSEASLTIPQIFSDPTNTVVADRTWDPSIPVMMPKINYLPTISVTSSTFDKNSTKQADMNMTVQNKGYALTTIKNGAETLGSSDYSASGNVVVLTKAYLAGLPEGTTTLSFNFGSISVPLTVYIINSDGSDIGKQVLAVNDGWASFTTGTKGGSAAAPSNIYTVTKRSELIQALGGDNSKNAANSTPKIIYVKGTIDMNVDNDDNPVGFDYYKDPAYDFNAYLAAYDPAVWGKTTVPSGPLETARAASETKQGNQIKINVGANTTIVGLPGSNAKILSGNLMVQNVDNVIIRNIDFQNAFDYFPQWDPTDGDVGNWNSAFDNITVKSATHIWIDHNTFSDGSNPDDYSIKYFGRHYQQHDGAMDITNASDLVTVSYNYYHDHDKTTLIGGSDGFTGDIGKERITFHHNYYKNIVQRAPRVRYGEVHMYNNYYEGTVNHASYPFLYTMGVGYSSQIYAQNNYFKVDPGTKESALIGVFTGGTTFTDIGSVLNGVDVNIGLNMSISPVSWTPTLFKTMDPTRSVPSVVLSSAGAENTVTLPPIDNTVPTTMDNAPAGWVNNDVTVTFTATDSGSGAAETYYTVDGGTQEQGTSVVITTEGKHTISYWSVDKAGNVESPHTVFVQIDKTDPTLKVDLDKTTLGPPNHQWITVHAAVNADDSLSGIASVVLTSITSNEPDNGLGDGDTESDIQGAQIGTLDTEFMLRAERSGKGSGRIYTITYTAIDQVGNNTTRSAIVKVPYNQSGK